MLKKEEDKIQDKSTLEKRLVLLSHTVQSMKECVTITDINDRIIFVNDAFMKTYGYEESELMGQHISMVRSPNNDQERIRKILPQTKEGSWQGELINRKKDGTDFPIYISSTIVTDEDGKTIALVGIATDITERKKAEETLRKTEVQYRNLVESMPDGIYRSTPEGRFVEVNPAMVKILGYDDKEDLMSIDIKTQLYFDLSDRDSAILTEQFEEMAVYPLKKKDGSKIWVEDHGWLVNDAHGNTLFHEGILRDVTDRVQIELQLQKYAVDLKVSNETKDKLFSIIAHDLRSPFNSILGFSQLLFDEYQSFSDEEKKSFIFKIKQSAEKTLTLLENLLTWARLQQGAFKVSPEKNDLYLIAGQQIELLRHTADLKKISLISAISPGTFIQVDRAMIKTVLLNLISNAIKFTVPEGIITLNSRKQGKQVEISVTDTGIGISSDDLESLFKVGHIRSTLGTSNETGTGLGLIICKEFVELNGGHIWAESEAGKGSTFFFTVPSNIVQG